LKKTKTTNVFLEIAVKYKENFGLDFIPLCITNKDKKPIVSSWGKWKENEQTIEELKRLNWKNADGLGMINKTIATLDFDCCADLEFVKSLINELGGKYWLVKSGRGFHMHFVIDGIEHLEIKYERKGVYKFYPKVKGILDHIEVRLNRCYTAFPPSKHFNGLNYEFINGEPDCLPDKIDSIKLFNVLDQYFFISNKDVNTNSKSEMPNEFDSTFINGVDEGNRHPSLTKIFGTFHSRGMSRAALTTILKEWNNKNRPPIPEKELNIKLNDLFRRYDKGLDGIFIQFKNCLLQLDDDDKLKIEKIICYGLVEYGGDRKIIEELGIANKLIEYHQECKRLVEHYENWTGRNDQIVRIGQTLMLDAYYKRFRFEYFCIYVGIISFLGRNTHKPSKQISHNIIRFRSMGFKNEAEYLLSNCKATPMKESTIRSGIKNIEDRNLLRSFSLVKGRMKWFSTFIETKEKLAEYVKNCEIKKLHKKNTDELLRSIVQREIRNEKEKLDATIKNNQMNAFTSPSSIHLPSNEN
jgi:hypothetical protein